MSATATTEPVLTTVSTPTAPTHRAYELTPARLAAARANGARSNGPVSDEGKAIVSRNALKHGLRARSPILPGEDPQAHQERLEAWSTDLRVRTGPEHDMLRRAVNASMALERCEAHDAAALARKRDHLDDDRAAQDAARLQRATRALAQDPLTSLHELMSIPHGCEWLLGRWDQLRLALQRRGHWDALQLTLALNLLGRHPDDLFDDPQAHALAQAAWSAARLDTACTIGTTRDPKQPDQSSNSLQPSSSTTARPLATAPPATDFRAQLELLRPGHVPERLFHARLDALAHDLPEPPAAARAALRDLCDREIAALEARLAHVAAQAEADRAYAADEALIDTGPNAALVLRYRAMAHRELRHALQDLAASRQDHEGTLAQRYGPPARPTPAYAQAQAESRAFALQVHEARLLQRLIERGEDPFSTDRPAKAPAPNKPKDQETPVQSARPETASTQRSDQPTSDPKRRPFSFRR